MSEYIYGLCAFTSLLCACLLLLSYKRSHYKLLLWGGLCFAGLTLNNILVVIDKFVVPDIDLSAPRQIIALIAMLVLLYGLIWNKEWKMINAMLLGSIATTCFIASLFFLRFWKDTKDRFFLFFAGAFLIQGIERIVLGLNRFSSEQEPLIYLIRLLAFLIILYAIIDKNWLRNRKIS